MTPPYGGDAMSQLQVPSVTHYKLLIACF